MLELICQSIREELKFFNKFYRKTLKTSINEIQPLLNFVLNKKGKQIRPITLILSAKLCGIPTYETFKYAVILELLHLSTLIHDDIIDNGFFRRKELSVMAKFGNKTAVLLGDYILSKAITLSVKTKKISFLRIMANLSNKLCEGELTQLVSSKIFMEEDFYLKIIRQKTAYFFSACSEMGALSVHANLKKRKLLQTIGENLGICFQITDDLLDYLKLEEVNESTYHNMTEIQIPLPLIYALKTAPKKQSDYIIKLIKKQNLSFNNIEKILSFTREQHGITHTKEKMMNLKQKIIELLNFFPPSVSKQSMITLVDYVINRTI